MLEADGSPSSSLHLAFQADSIEAVHANAASREFAPLDLTWGYSGVARGWTVRLRRKKRTILYLTPCRRHFSAGLVLGEKAVQAARRSDLPSAVLDVIAKSQKYAEGTGIRLDVRNKRDLEAVLALTRIKMTH